MAWLAEHAGKDATELSKRAIAELAKAASSRFKVQGSKSAADDSLEL
jgi:hypothetical protein